MTPLRQQMIDAMTVRGYSPRTHESYLAAVRHLAEHYHRSPQMISAEEVRQWIGWLAKDKGLSASTCRQYLHAVHFLFEKVLHNDALEQIDIPLPKRPQKIPELLTKGEVRRIILACENAKHQTMLRTAYGCGLRVSELCHLRLAHIDSERQLLRIEQSKGLKDRLVPIPVSLLNHLRQYWAEQRPHPNDWLFPRQHHLDQSLSISTIQRVYTQAKRRTRIDKPGGIHGLRHAYASHQLEAGLPVHILQRYLGHTNLQSTLRYVHWLPTLNNTENTAIDLLAEP